MPPRPSPRRSPRRAPVGPRLAGLARTGLARAGLARAGLARAGLGLTTLTLAGCGQQVLAPPVEAWERVVVDSIGDALVLDARTAAEHAAGHVPGAAQVHWTELTGPDAHGLWDALPPDQLAALFAARGVGTDRPVVIYGSGPQGYGDDGNVYWALRWLGHPDVRVLNGGWLGWLAAGGEVATDAGPPPADFTVDLDPTVYASTEAVAAWQGPILDVRSQEEWEAGRVPGATWMEWTEVYDEAEALLGEAEQRALLAAHGVDGTAPVVTYCAGGIRAGHTFMVLDALGIEAANYVGSWARWTAEGGEVDW